MFTGIISHVGTVRELERGPDSLSLTVEAAATAADAAIGDSICVDGVCLTVTRAAPPRIGFYVSAETLRLTTLGALRQGDPVNLEASLRMGDRLGGHFVSGHVDGTGVIRRKEDLPGEVRLAVQTEPRLTDLMVLKGSVAVDGISLTVAALEAGSFEVSLIPHTLAATTMKTKRPGDRVNIECDMLGRYVRRALGQGETSPSGTALTVQELEDQGF
jgi:riboflavin synthase